MGGCKQKRGGCLVSSGLQGLGGSEEALLEFLRGCTLVGSTDFEP